MAQTKQKRPEGTVVWITAIVCLFTLGWFARQLTFRPKVEPKPPLPPPMVTVKAVEVGIVNPPIRYVGHVDAIQSVDIRARVSGYLKEVTFKEGATVKAGDVLFRIDDEDYKARVAQSKAEIAKAQAALERFSKQLKRMEEADPRSISPLDLDNVHADIATSKAQIAEAEANLQLAEIDLKHTVISAPVGGQIGQKFVSTGDYITPSSDTLAKVVQMDPIRVVFSMTDRDFMMIKHSAAKNASASQVHIWLPDGTEYPKSGSWDFFSNEMAPGTATLPIWVKFDNADNVLLPNTFVTVYVDPPNTQQVTMVDVQAITHTVQGDYVFRVNSSNVAEMVRVKLGKSTENVYAVLDGLKAGDHVVVEGVQSVRPGVTVHVKEAAAGTNAPAQSPETK